MTSEINISYNNNNITTTVPGVETPIVTIMPNTFTYNNNYSGSKLQYILRKLDCLKDAKEGDGIKDKSVIMSTLFPDLPNIPDDLLKDLKTNLINENKDRIDNDSWLKSSSSTVNYDYIKNVFYETGLGPEEYIVDFKNPTIKPFSMIGSFPSEIGDPGSRKPEKFDERFPKIGTKLLFSETFMDYFGFGPNTIYSATLLKDDNKIGTYQYSIDLGTAFINQKQNIINVDEINPKNEGELVVNRFSSTTNFNPTDTFQSCDKTFPLLNKVTGNEYFKGNNYKNALINDLYYRNSKTNMPEIKRYIFAKEMGDVMQVLLMMVWQIVQQTPNKKNYCMTTLDSIVFILCIILEQPCLYTNNSNKGLAAEDKCYRIQYYYPAVITSEERMRTRFQQKYNEIYFNNLKIKNFYNRIFIEKIIYIGNYAVNFEYKKENIIKYFLNPINEVFETISKELELFNDENKNSSNLSIDEINIMQNKFFILPIFGLREKGKKIYYYINPGINNYTLEQPYSYTGLTNPTFLEVFEKLNSGTLPLRSTSGINDEVIGQKRKRSGGSLSTVTVPTLHLSSSSDDIINEKIDDSNGIENVTNLMDKKNSSISEIPIEMEEEINMDIEEDNFTFNLFSTFINQVVTNLQDNDLSLIMDIEGYGPLDKDAIYYYYYDMLVYLSYIQKQVYYNNDLLTQMSKLTLYSKKEISLEEIISNPIEINVEVEMSDSIIEGCSLSKVEDLTETGLIKGKEYTKELFNTFNAVKNLILKTDNEMQEEYKVIEESMNSENPLNNSSVEMDSEKEDEPMEPMEVDSNPISVKEDDLVTPIDKILKSSSSEQMISPASKKSKSFGGTVKRPYKKQKKTKKVKKNKKKKRSIKKNKKMHKKTLKK
jgi:hypothetical protein